LEVKRYSFSPCHPSLLVASICRKSPTRQTVRSPFGKSDRVGVVCFLKETRGVTEKEMICLSMEAEKEEKDGKLKRKATLIIP